MKRTIIISIFLTLCFATICGAASKRYLTKQYDELIQEPYKFLDLLEPTFEALDNYCYLAKRNLFTSADDRITREDILDEMIDDLKIKDIYIQNMAQELAQDSYDSGYTSTADEIIEGANRSNDMRVEAIVDILDRYNDCLDE